MLLFLEDEVYMDDENKLREYILKQNGQIYIGKHTRPRPRNWYFGQFEEISLDTVFKLLESVKANKRDSPVEVSRIISSKVNCFIFRLFFLTDSSQMKRNTWYYYHNQAKRTSDNCYSLFFKTGQQL